MAERTMRLADVQTRPGWALIEVVEDGAVVKRLAFPRKPIVPPADVDDDE